MLSKRIIPCLDIRDGRTVKGTRFEKLADLGDPLELAAQYDAAGADELVFLDITATTEGRRTRARLVTRIAKTLSIPFTVGGGIRQLEDVRLLLEAGADKVSVNSAAFRRPGLLEEIAGRYGRQCLVLAIDSRWKAGEGYVCLDGGSTPTGVRAVDWARQAEALGAGELLLTAIDCDGMRQGFACDHIRALSDVLSIPVIASGGAGRPEHFAAVFRDGGADAALAAGIFHTGEVNIPELKAYLAQKGLPIRL